MINLGDTPASPGLYHLRYFLSCPPMRNWLLKGLIIVNIWTAIWHIKHFLCNADLALENGDS